MAGGLPSPNNHGNVSWNYEPSVAWIVAQLSAFRTAGASDDGTSEEPAVETWNYGSDDTVTFTAGKHVVEIAADVNVQRIIVPAGAEVILRRAASCTANPALGVTATSPWEYIDLKGSLTFDGVDCYPNNSKNQWSMNEQRLAIAADAELKLTGNSFFCTKRIATDGGTIVVDPGSSFFFRETAQNGFKLTKTLNLDLGGTFQIFNSALDLGGALKVTFRGAGPKLDATAVGAPDGETYNFVLPSVPYAKAPLRSGGSDWNPSAGATVTIDPNSPALTSGAVQTYRLIDWSSADKGVDSAKFSLPVPRAGTEAIAWSPKAGTTSPLQQFLDATVDGTREPTPWGTAATGPVTDELTYTWKQSVASGDWKDPANWDCDGVGVGYPTAKSTAVFTAGTTNVVTLTEDLEVASVTLIPDDASVTLRGSGVRLLAPSIGSSGARSTLTLDGVKLTDNDNLWNIAWWLCPGNGTVIRVCGAGGRLEAKKFVPGGNVRLEVCNGAYLFLRESGGAAADLLLDNGVLEVPDHTIPFASVTFRGTAPQLRVCDFTADPTTLVFELPVAPYATAPIRQSTMVGQSKRNLTGGTVNLAVVIAKASPARTDRGARRATYPLVDWTWDAAYGVTAEAFSLNPAVSLIKSAESFTLERQNLDFNLVPSVGMTILVR